MSIESHPDLKAQMEYELRQAQLLPHCKDCDLGAIRAKYAQLAQDETDRLARIPGRDRRRFRT